MEKIQTQLLESLNEYVAFARKRLSDPELAADAVQDSLLKALNAADGVRDDKNVKAWFYGILRRTIIDLYRSRDVYRRAVAQIQSDLSSPFEGEEQVVCGCIDTLIPTLKPQYSTLLQRLDLGGETRESVAANLGITTNNLTVRLHRARRLLKERLTQTCRLCARNGCLDCTCDTPSNQEI